MKFKGWYLIADPLGMESELRSAWIAAGVKMALGLLFVGAWVGVRVFAVSSSESVAAADAGSTRVGESPQREPQDNAPKPLNAPRMTPVGEAAVTNSVLGRVIEGVRGQLPGPRTDSRDGYKMVSCRLASKARFMRADDCATRGGASKAFQSDR